MYRTCFGLRSETVVRSQQDAILLNEQLLGMHLFLIYEHEFI